MTLLYQTELVILLKLDIELNELQCMAKYPALFVKSHENYNRFILLSKTKMSALKATDKDFPLPGKARHSLF